jgi:hypothetical protein
LGLLGIDNPASDKTGERQREQNQQSKNPAFYVHLKTPGYFKLSLTAR